MTVLHGLSTIILAIKKNNGMGMIRQIFVLFLSLSLLLNHLGCYTSLELSRTKLTEGQVKEKIEVFTKQGKSYVLVKYEITNNKIIGYDRDGKQYEDLLEDVESITIISRLNKKRTIIVATFVLILVLFFYYYFSIQGFGQLR